MLNLKAFPQNLAIQVFLIQFVIVNTDPNPDPDPDPDPDQDQDIYLLNDVVERDKHNGSSSNNTITFLDVL